MLSACDGCERIIAKRLTLVTAKQWRPSLCDTAIADAPVCKRFDCRYNIEDGCIDYQFCDSCLSSPEVLDRTFVAFRA
ncbi:MAG: hypothetical protein ACLQNE_21820 [Thermoguttaceae bacterium]